MRKLRLIATFLIVVPPAAVAAQRAGEPQDAEKTYGRKLVAAVWSKRGLSCDLFED